MHKDCFGAVGGMQVPMLGLCCRAFMQVWLDNARYAARFNLRNPAGAWLGLNGLADRTFEEWVRRPLDCFRAVGFFPHGYLGVLGF